MNEKEKFQLIKADEKDAKYSNPLIRLLLTLGYLGIFGSIICIYMIIMSSLSSNSGAVEITFMAAVIIFLAVCIAAVTVLSILDKKARKEFYKKEKQLRKNAKKYKGKIVGAEKNIRHVKYMSDVFDEIIWNFVIKFKDENNEIVTIKSDRFLNDISEVLKNQNVIVYALEDGTFEFGGYKLRENTDDEFVKLKVKVYEEESRI